MMTAAELAICADVNVSVLKYSGKRGNPRETTVRVFPA
jgi:hypothetical protein